MIQHYFFSYRKFYILPIGPINHQEQKIAVLDSTLAFSYMREKKYFVSNFFLKSEENKTTKRQAIQLISQQSKHWGDNKNVKSS